MSSKAMRGHRIATLLVIGSILVTGSAKADEFLISDRRTISFDTICTGSNSGSNDISVAIRVACNRHSRALIYTDLSGLSPASVITSVKLRMYCTDSSEYVTNSVDVYRVAELWDPSNAIWTDRTAADGWATEGGTYTTVDGANTLVPSKGSSGSVPYQEWIEWDVTEIVRGWVRGEYPNYGLIAIQPPVVNNANQALNFANTTHLDPSLRPRLVIDGELKYADSEPQYIYDELDRLSEVRVDNGVRIAYDYDPAGNRTRKEVTGRITLHQGNEPLEFAAAGTSSVNVPMLSFACEVDSNEAVELNFIGLNASGTGDESNAVTDARLWIDANATGTVDIGDVQLGPAVTDIDNDGAIWFNGLNETLPANSATHFLVSYTFNGTPALGDTFELDLVERTQISAIGLSSAKNLYVLGAPALGPRVTITNDNTVPTFAGLTNAVAQSRSVLLTWVAATDPSAPITYRIWQSTTPFGGIVSGPPTYSTTNTSFPATGLTNGVTYYFVVRAEDGVGNRETNAVEDSATPAPTLYSLSVNAANGSVLPLPPDGAYESGTRIDVLASAAPGFAFSSWAGDVPPGQQFVNPVQLTMDTNKSLTANFVGALGSVQIDSTPNNGSWSFVDALGTVRSGDTDLAFNGIIPAGGVEATWNTIPGYRLPKANPVSGSVPPGGGVTLTGVYVPQLSFTVQPQSLKRYVGESASFSVAATGVDGLAKYVWKFDDGQAGPNQVGGNANAYLIPSVGLTHAGTYTCELTDDYPQTIVSSAVTLQSGEHVGITTQPTGADLLQGQPYTLSVVATGGVGTRSYQWSKDGFPIPGATASTYSISGAVVDDTGLYAVTISDEHTDVVVSADAQINVDAVASVPLVSPWMFVLAIGLLLLVVSTRRIHR